MGIRVAWFIDLEVEDGETIIDYARGAAQIQREQTSNPNGDGFTGVFEVIDENGTVFEVDLESDEVDPPSVIQKDEPTPWGAQVVMSEASVDQALTAMTLSQKERGLLTMLLGMTGASALDVLGRLFGLKQSDIALTRTTKDDADGRAGYPETQEFTVMGKRVRMTLEYIGGELSLKEDGDDARTAG